MSITEHIVPARKEWTVQCDAPGCTNGLHTVTDTKLVDILRGLHWWVGTETPPLCYCPHHTALMQKDGLLGPKLQN